MNAPRGPDHDWLKAAQDAFGDVLKTVPKALARGIEQKASEVCAPIEFKCKSCDDVVKTLGMALALAICVRLLPILEEISDDNGA